MSDRPFCRATVTPDAVTLNPQPGRHARGDRRPLRGPRPCQRRRGVASLHGPLVQGDALDALEAAALQAPRRRRFDDAREFLALLLVGHVARGRGIGLGESLSFAFGGLAGTGVAVDAELVTLTAFADDEERSSAGPRRVQAGRVRRPSRRRIG